MGIFGYIKFIQLITIIIILKNELLDSKDKQMLKRERER